MKKIYPYLTYAGVLPFVLSAGCLAFGVQTFPFLGDVKGVFTMYGLLIAAFMSGVHWGQHLNLEDSWAVFLPALSNALTLVLFFSSLVFPFSPLIGILIAVFLVLLGVDYKLFKEKQISHHYFQTRCTVTLIAVLSMIMMFVCS